MISVAPAPTPGDLKEPPVLELGRTALFADLDGTLAPIEATPADVKPDAARRRLLDSLSSALGGRLAIISGRGLIDLDRLLEGRIRPVAAVHGLVRRRADGVLAAAAAQPRIEDAFVALRDFARRDPRLLVENKDAAVALHYRRAPALETDCRDFVNDLAGRCGLEIQSGDMVAELLVPGPDKGGAVAAFMREPPFAGFRPVYVGDDLTDEAAVLTVQALGGYGVLVGSRRPTEALYGLGDVDAVGAWLARALEPLP
jgi:trehalose 6-phosphate phosphatase